MAIGAAVKEAYDEVLVPAGMDDVAIFTELGRFMLAPYGCLVSKVLHEKHIWKDYVGLDACAANLMRAVYVRTTISLQSTVCCQRSTSEIML